MLKKGIAVFMVLCAFGFGAQATAQGVKIGVVSMPRLLDQSPQAKDAMQVLQSEFEPRQRAIQELTVKLKGLEDRLKKDGPVMSDEERRKSERDLRDQQRDLTRRQNEFVEDLNVARSEQLGKLNRDLLIQVQEYAKSAGYDLIVGDGVLYASGAVDITAGVLERL
ncbi:MAG: OmpH family outer membrane protein, partial [Pseudomonadota bacterium]